MIRSIGVEEYINAFLVDKGVRPGMLLEPADYKERTEKDPIIKERICSIRAAFPSLKVIVTPFHQALLTKDTQCHTEDLNSCVKIGHAIGYPCADEYLQTLAIHDKEYTHAIEIILRLYSHIEMNTHEFQIFANKCISLEKQPVFETIAHKAHRAIQTDPTLSLLVESVFVRVSTVIPPIVLMNKLIQGGDFTQEEMDEFDNILFNLGCREDDLLGYTFTFANPVHRGVGITLLSLFLHNPASPFYPLQRYPGKLDEVNRETHAFAEELRNALDSAK